MLRVPTQLLVKLNILLGIFTFPGTGLFRLSKQAKKVQRQQQRDLSLVDL